MFPPHISVLECIVIDCWHFDLHTNKANGGDGTFFEGDNFLRMSVQNGIASEAGLVCSAVSTAQQSRLHFLAKIHRNNYSIEAR